MRLIDIDIPRLSDIQKLDEGLLPGSSRYWLQDRSELQGYALYVENDGSVHTLGCNVQCRGVCIRPMAKLSGVSDDDIGKTVSFGGREFVVIDKTTGFASDVWEESVFNTGWDQPGSNNYDGSIVKQKLSTIMRSLPKEA